MNTFLGPCVVKKKKLLRQKDQKVDKTQQPFNKRIGLKKIKGPGRKKAMLSFQPVLFDVFALSRVSDCHF